MWDTKTLATIKTIDVQGGPDGILFDPFNERVWVFSHSAPNATVIDAKDGSIVGTVDLGGAPEQAVTDGKGHIYVDHRRQGQRRRRGREDHESHRHITRSKAKAVPPPAWPWTSRTTSSSSPAATPRTW